MDYTPVLIYSTGLLQPIDSSNVIGPEFSFELRVDGRAPMDPEAGAQNLGNSAKEALLGAGNLCQQTVHQGLVARTSSSLPDATQRTNTGGGQGSAAESCHAPGGAERQATEGGDGAVPPATGDHQYPRPVRHCANGHVTETGVLP